MPSLKSIIAAVLARTGGVGKTSTAVSVASVAAAAGQDVVVVDLDPQSSASAALGVDPVAVGSAEWLQGGEPAFQCPQPGLRVLAGGPNLEILQRIDPTTLLQRSHTLGADLVVLDTAPGASALSRAAMSVADIALVMSIPHPLALTGATSILAGLRPDQRRVLVLSRVDHRRRLHRDICAGAASVLGVDVLTVRMDVLYERALAEGRPIAVGFPCRRAYSDIAAIYSWMFPDTAMSEELAGGEE